MERYSGTDSYTIKKRISPDPVNLGIGLLYEEVLGDDLEKALKILEKAAGR